MKTADLDMETHHRLDQLMSERDAAAARTREVRRRELECIAALRQARMDAFGLRHHAEIEVRWWSYRGIEGDFERVRVVSIDWDPDDHSPRAIAVNVRTKRGKWGARTIHRRIAEWRPVQDEEDAPRGQINLAGSAGA